MNNSLEHPQACAWCAFYAHLRTMWTSPMVYLTYCIVNPPVKLFLSPRAFICRQCLQQLIYGGLI